MESCGLCGCLYSVAGSCINGGSIASETLDASLHPIGEQGTHLKINYFLVLQLTIPLISYNERQTLET